MNFQEILKPNIIYLTQLHNLNVVMKQPLNDRCLILQDLYFSDFNTSEKNDLSYLNHNYPRPYQYPNIQFHISFMSAAFLLILGLLAITLQGTPSLFAPSPSADPQTYYKKVVHNYDPEARCLDGSPSLLYVHEGGDTRNFLIFFEGGGLCGEETLAKTVESCYQRSKTLLGSSKPWPDVLVGQGYLSADPAVSAFAGWTKFVLGYCDGALHQGFTASPLKYKDTELYFRGATITRAHFAWMEAKYGLRGAEKVMVTGGSAGGIAVHLWSNYLRGFVRDTEAVRAVDDSGVFLNTKTVLGDAKIEKMTTNVYKVANIDESTPLAGCNALYPGEEWKCLFIEHAYTALTGPFLIINSEYDAWAIPNILEVKCLKGAVAGGQTLSGCSSRELTHIENYRSLYREVLTKLLTANPEASIWSIACSNHVYACLNVFYNSQFQRVPQLVGSTIKQAVEAFMLEKKRVVNYDLNPWPANSPCAK